MIGSVAPAPTVASTGSALSVLWLLPCVAVVPSLLGPLQALMLALPQVLLGAVLGVKSLANPALWLGGLRRGWTALLARPVRGTGWLAAVGGAGWFAWWLLQPVPTLAEAPGALMRGVAWPTFHRDATRCGAAESADLSGTPKLRWKFRDSLILERLPFACSPAVAGGRVVIGSDNFKLYCLDLEAGELHWTFGARWPIFSSPCLWNGRVYIGEGLHENTDSKLYCLDLATGAVKWSIQTSSHTESTPTVADGKVFFGAGGDGVYCVETEATAQPGAAGATTETGYRSRLMWAADALIVGLVGFVAERTGSYGLALVLVALAVKLVLLPLDLRQARELQLQRKLREQTDRLRHEHLDFRVHRYEVRKLFEDNGVRLGRTLACALVQVPLFVVVFLVLQATPVFAGRQCLWIADLSAPDRLGQLLWSGADANLLPLALGASLWMYVTMTGRTRARGGPLAESGRLAFAVALAVMTYRWSAGLLLFTLALVWVGTVQLTAASRWQRLRAGDYASAGSSAVGLSR